MPRTALTPSQKIIDLFADLDCSEQAKLMGDLGAFHRFCLKRDGSDRGSMSSGIMRSFSKPQPAEPKKPRAAAKSKDTSAESATSAVLDSREPRE